MAKKSRQGQKQCPKCNAWVKGTRAKTCAKCGYQFRAKQHKPAAPVAVTAEPEKTAKAGAMLTLEHVKAVALTVKTLGGYGHVNELLVTVKDVGGLRRFKDLLEAMCETDADEIKV